MIKASAADKLQINRPIDDLVLAEVKSNGERTVYKDHDVSIPTTLYLNARIFVSSKDHIDALVSNFQYFTHPKMLTDWAKVCCTRHNTNCTYS